MSAVRRFLALCLAAAAPAQWIGEALPAGPAGATGACAAYLTAQDQLLVFGGLRNGTTDEFWRFTGDQWVAMTSSPRPSPRMDARMVYMDLRGRVLLYGGTPQLFQPDLDDTWEFDGSSWTQLSPAQTPGGRSGMAMAYDVLRDRVVLFGGVTNLAQIRGDTWEWNGLTWQQVFPATNPPMRHQAAMAYDLVRGAVVMFGGVDVSGPPNATTWTYDGINWTPLSPPASPPARSRASMVFDWRHGRCRLVGGFNGSLLGYHDDSWEFDGTTWQRSAGPAPTGSTGAAMAYDPTRDLSVLVGGSRVFAVADRTWTFGARAVPIGAGCPGSAGTPTLGATAPRLGATMAVSLQNLVPVAAFAGLAFGLSPQDLDLTALGLPGCRLSAAIDEFVLLPAAGGSATASLPVAATPSLFGAEVWLTGLSFDAASPVGAVPTGSLRLVVGQ